MQKSLFENEMLNIVQKPTLHKTDVSRSTFYHGDCLVEINKIADKSVDMILCDLPYGTTNNYWDTLINLPMLWAEYKRCIKDNCPIILTSSQPFTTMLISSNIKAFRHNWYWIKSRATGFQRVSIEPLRSVEDVSVFYEERPYDEVETSDLMIELKSELKLLVEKSGLNLKELNSRCGFEASGYLRKSSSWKNVIPTEQKLQKLSEVLLFDYDIFLKKVKIAEASVINKRRTFNPQGLTACAKSNKRGRTGTNWQEMKQNEYEVMYENYPTNILEIASEAATLHPTQKPVELMEYLIKTYTNEGETVLDNCMGSGTTGVACKKTGRHFIGIEKDEKYFDIAVSRVSAYCG